MPANPRLPSKTPESIKPSIKTPRGKSLAFIPAMLRRGACPSSLLSLLAKHRNHCKNLFRDLQTHPEIAVVRFAENPVLQQHSLKPQIITQQYPFHSPTVSFRSTPQILSDVILSSSNSKTVENLTHKFTLSKILSRYFCRSFQVPYKSPICQPPRRSFATLPQNASVLSSRQRKVKERDELEEAFESASTTDEILSTFDAMESAFDATDKKLGLACLKVGQHLDSKGKDPTEALSYANRALEILGGGTTDGGKGSLPVAMALHLLGAVNYSLKRFSDSLAYLNRANRILNSMLASSDFDVRPVAHAVQLQLANTKTAMGRREEALVNLKKCLELKESIFEPNSKEMGIAYRDVAEAYVAVLNFKEALPICLKALDIHRALLGSNSVEVAHDRRVLGVIYSGLEEHEKALEENELSQRVLKSWGMSSDLLHSEIEAANIQIALGRYDQAIGTLKGVVQQTDKDSEMRALVFIAMAKALCNQEKFADSKRCLEISCGVLDKKESESPAKVAEAYAEISMLYETMNEFETAISLLKRAVAMLEKLPQEQHAEGSASARIGWLLLLTGKVPQAIPYLENAAERLIESFGPKHFGVGYIYNNLGAAYMELERPQSAAQMFGLAKEIMDASLGPNHADSIESCQNLANAYGAMGSYALAIEFQERVIDAWESHGPNAKDEYKEAHRLLEQLKKKARASGSEVPKNALPLPSASRKVSQSDVKVSSK